MAIGPPRGPQFQLVIAMEEFIPGIARSSELREVKNLKILCEISQFKNVLDCKEVQPVHSQGDQSWVFFGKNDAKAETPVLWPPHVKS